MFFPKLTSHASSWLIVLKSLAFILQLHIVASSAVAASTFIPRDSFLQIDAPGRTSAFERHKPLKLTPRKAEAELNRGFVICAGGPGREVGEVPDAVRTVAAIKSIRGAGNHNPVVVFHVDGELPDHEIRLLQEYKGVVVRDLTEVLDKDDMAAASGEANKFRSFDCKIMALLHSPFKQTVLIDSDTLFFENPDTVFNQKEMTDSGTMFFYDRRAVDINPALVQVQEGKCKSIVKFARWADMNTSMLVDFKRAHLSFCDGSSSHEQDASMVAVDSSHPAAMKFLRMLKQFHTKFLLRNATVQRWGFGDKEFYWIACEFAGVRCSFSPRGRPMHIFFEPQLEGKNLVRRQAEIETESPGCAAQVSLTGDGSGLFYANLSDKYCAWDTKLNAVTVWNPKRTAPIYHAGWVMSTGRGVRLLTSTEQVVANQYRDDVARLSKRS